MRKKIARAAAAAVIIATVLGTAACHPGDSASPGDPGVPDVFRATAAP